MKFLGQHILSTKQFDKEGLIELFETARKMEKVLDDAKKGKQNRILEGKLLATLFFEPSTRTRFSFETAMQRLGGKVISNFDMMNSSSVKKRETLWDTGKVVAQMADIIAMRHPQPGSVAELACGSSVPVINAGDGPNQHPTQALLDVYTIWKEFGKIDGLTIGMVGDLKYGRVPHSQCELLKHFDVKFIFVSPLGLAIPVDFTNELAQAKRKIEETEDLEGCIAEMDVIASTRIQEERFENKKEYEKYAGIYVLNSALMKKAKNTAIVIHPLPRVNEISTDMDMDPRAKYFEQVRNGVAVRMALMCKVLGVA